MFRGSMCRHLPSFAATATKYLQIGCVTLWLVCFSIAAQAEPILRFSHQVSINPIPPLPGVITFIGQEGGTRYKQVRVLLVLDGELLTIPLVAGGDGTSYRAVFPTPKTTMSYQFQVITDDGGARLSETFQVNPVCSGHVLNRTLSPDIKRAFFAQQQTQRLIVARDLLKKFKERLER